MFLAEVDSVSLIGILKGDHKILSFNNSEVVIQGNKSVSSVFIDFINFKISVGDLSNEFDSLDFILIHLHVAIPRILVFFSDVAILNNILIDDVCLENIIDYTQHSKNIYWHCYYLPSNENLLKKVINCNEDLYAIMSIDQIAYESEDVFYGLINSEEKEYCLLIQNIPNLKILRNFYVIENDIDLSFSLVKLSNIDDFIYYSQIRYSRDYPPVLLNQFNLKRIIGEESDSISVVRSNKVFDYFRPKIGYMPNYYDGLYDIYYLNSCMDSSEICYIFQNVIKNNSMDVRPSISHPYIEETHGHPKIKNQK